jgi:hypothetical protein
MQNTALTKNQTLLLYLWWCRKYDAISNKKDTIYKQNFKLKSNQLLTELEPLIREITV